MPAGPHGAGRAGIWVWRLPRLHLGDQKAEKFAKRSRLMGGATSAYSRDAEVFAPGGVWRNGADYGQAQSTLWHLERLVESGELPIGIAADSAAQLK